MPKRRKIKASAGKRRTDASSDTTNAVMILEKDIKKEPVDNEMELMTTPAVPTKKIKKEPVDNEMELVATPTLPTKKIKIEPNQEEEIISINIKEEPESDNGEKISDADTGDDDDDKEEQPWVFVGYLTKPTADEMKTLFSKYGEVLQTHLDSKIGFATVKMDNCTNAANAEKALHGMEYRGRKISVKVAYGGNTVVKKVKKPKVEKKKKKKKLIEEEEEEESDESECDDIEEHSCRLCAKRYKNGAEAMKKYFSDPEDGEARAKKFLAHHGLLPLKKRCPTCNVRLRLLHDRYRCNKRNSKGVRCRLSSSEKLGSILYHIRMTYQDFLAFLFEYLFSNYRRIRAEREIPTTTAVTWTNLLSTVCQHYVENQTPIGGPGTTVQIDEIFVCNRKEDFGVRKEFWLIWGTEQDGDRKFFYWFEGEPCSSEHLIPRIQQFVTPGGSVVVKRNPVYKQLDELGYKVKMRNLGAPSADELLGDLDDNLQTITRYNNIHLHLSRYIFIKSFESEESRLHQFLKSAASLYPLP